MMQTSPEPQGCLPSFAAWVFGPRAARLTERANRTHWLSYLLIISQSIAVVLVFGHAEVPLLLNANVAIRALAMMVLFVLIITVIAADIALLETLTRVPALARNRQGMQVIEHIAYVLFVLATEGSTYAVVLAAIDSDPQALVSGRPLIPTAGPLFAALVVLRVVLICWSAVQLIVVRSTLPVLLSTLMTQGKEIVGAHNLEQLKQMDIRGVTMLETFGIYARMAQPPRPIRSWWNGWLVQRALAREAEEQRQADNVKEAFAALNAAQQRAEQAVTPPPAAIPSTRFEATEQAHTATQEAAQTSAPAEPDHPDLTAEAILEQVRRELHLPAPDAAPDPEPPSPPTDGGSPTFASKRTQEAAITTPLADNVTPMRRGLGRAPRSPQRDRRVVNRANARSGKRGSAEYRVRQAVASKPDIEFDELVHRAKVAPSTASKWLEVINAEKRTRTHREAQ